jgi:HPt (histidine-containing phosphotransfer) domain-containing protein
MPGDALRRLIVRRKAVTTVAVVEPLEQQAPLFDDNTYLDLFRDEGEVGIAWLDGYLATTASAIDRIGQAIEASDRDALRIAVHTMAGASLTAGAMRLGGLAAEFDHVALTVAPAELHRYAEQLLSTFQATRSAIERYTPEKTVPAA